MNSGMEFKKMFGRKQKPAVRYGERKRTEYRSRYLLIDIQFAYAPRTAVDRTPGRLGSLYRIA
jgi:hypothetical protein